MRLKHLGGVPLSVNMEAEIPETLDVMALPGVTLFPGALLPLFIFEPRYRKMLARALGGHRMFAIGQPLSDEDESGLFATGGAGLIRACVANPDGTSHLVLQGITRVRFADWTTIEACRHARVTALESSNSNPAAAQVLRGEVYSLCERLAKENEELSRMVEAFSDRSKDPAEFSDLVGATAVRDAAIRQRLLEELDVIGRLEILAAYLTSLVGPA
ncbi:LON peptidase substrate-binding domain-containing protein [soil metagenome]